MVELARRLLACISAFMFLAPIGIISLSIIPNNVIGYPEHGNIIIDGDSEFLTDDSVIAGNGTAIDPFIIADWRINGSYNYGVHIKNTRAFFIVRNVAIENSTFSAIRLENVSNGRVENSSLINNLGNGIYLMSAENMTISNCSIHETGTTAILGNSVKNAVFKGITARGMDKAVYFEGCSALSITGCRFENATSTILSMSRCAGSSIEDSVMRNATLRGIELNFVNNSNFFGNAIINASTGIHLHYCNLLAFHGNMICMSRASQVQSTSSSVRWNLTYVEGGGNYWSNYLGPDDYNGASQDKPGSDGIIDVPFTILPGNVDAYPLSSLRFPYTDNVPPVSNASVLGEAGIGGWYKSFAIIVINATDDFSGIMNISYSIDSSPYIEYKGSFKITDSGEHIVCYHATDRMQNQESEKMLSVKVDSAPPVTEILLQGTKGQGNWYLSSIAITLNATDNESGVASTWYSIDAGTAMLYSSIIIVSSDGYHNIVTYSIDAVGNTGPVSLAQISIDRDAPELAINEANGSVFTSLPVTISWTASDSVSGLDYIEVSVDGGSFTRLLATRKQYSISGISDGNHVLTILVFDKAGHMTEGQISFRSETGIVGILMSNLLTILALIVLAAVVIFALIVRSRRRRRG